MLISMGRIMLSVALLEYVRLLDLRNAARIHLYVFQNVSLRDAATSGRSSGLEKYKNATKTMM